MKKLLSALPILLGLASVAVPVFGAQEDDLEIRMTPATLISVTIAPSLVDFGNVPLGQETASSETVTATNNGSLAVDLEIKGSDAHYSSYKWGLSTSSDHNQYMAKVSKDNWTTPPQALNTLYSDFHNNLVADANVPFKVKVTMPTSTSGFGEYSTNIYVLATQSL